MVVQDAYKVTDFHVNTLGFKFKYEKLINTGRVEDGKYDMINHILELPNNPECVCVVTQGLTEETVFNKLLKKYGEGIHHMAYLVNDIEESWDICQKNNIILTSNAITFDPISNLKQFFITREYAGYVIEIIQRNEISTVGDFTEGNMKDLAQSIGKFIK